MDLPIDHLVYAVPDLEASLDWFEENTGIRPSIGGRHLNRGTHNAIVNIGNGAYLEIVAADPTNTDIPPPRWMGVDRIEKATMTRWALKSDDLDRDAAALRSSSPALGNVTSGSRQLTDGSLLSWRMSLPAPTPAVELMPFFLDWSSSAFHPTERLATGYELIELSFGHPDPETVQILFSKLGLNTRVQQFATPTIRATVNTPMGVVTLK